MNDLVTWCVAVLLACAGVAAEGLLAWIFIRDWREGRADECARRARRRQASKRVARSPNRLRFHAGAALAVVGMTAGLATAQAPSAPSEEASASDASATIGSAISVQLNLDFTNAYFYRGIRQQDKGLIVQPAARLTTRLVDDAEFKLDGFVGTWNSFGPNGGANTGDLSEDWYEADLYGGLTATWGKLALTSSYTFLTSPSDAYETVQELAFTLALDDSDWMTAHSMEGFSLKPYATLAMETGADASDGADSDTGTYMELGIAPGFSFDVRETAITLTFPTSVGLSLSDYYQDSSGRDDTFGFVQTGAKASIPLGELGAGGRFGAWTLNAGVSVLFLGDHTEDYNGGDSTELIGTVGLQINF